MRTKTLILAAVLSAVGVATSSAQVFSQNAVGYVNKTFTNGYTLFANPLNNKAANGNTLSNLFPSAPLFANFYKWNGSGFDIATFTPGGWDLPNLLLAPGEGAFFNTDTTFTNTFVGDVEQGNLTNPIPTGFSTKASKVPQAGPVDTLGLTNLSTFDNLYKWNGSGYTIYTVLPGGTWDPATPSLGIAEGVFLNASVATSWNRTFSVSN
jgi:hypothetical protein